MSERILIIEDEENQREILSAILRSEGYSVKTASKGEDAKKIYKEFNPRVVLSDLKLPDGDGIQVMDEIKSLGGNCEFIIITAYGSITSAVDAIKKGAFDYIPKPIERDKLLLSVQRAVERNCLLKENIELKKQLQMLGTIDGIIGNHPSIIAVKKLIKTIAEYDVNVLILGETGTGKGLVAKAIHNHSGRVNKPFHFVNTPAIPETLFESELFGYERGAFTGAYNSKAGLIELADGGTLFFDEIAEIPTHVQAKLLRFIEEKRIMRIGGKEEIPVDVRIIAATNRDLSSEVKAGRFRDDLYYRLNVFTIKLPPLRERILDINLLVKHFIDKYNIIHRKRVVSLSPEALKILRDYHWPGNVRELESVIERALLIATTETIRPEEIFLPVQNSSKRYTISIPPEGLSSWEEFEKDLILQAMEKAGNNISRASKLLGMSYRTLQYRLKKFGIVSNETPNGAENTPVG